MAIRLPVKKIFFFTFLLSLCLIFWADFSFARELEVPLPAIGGQEEITKTPILSAYVKYIFTLAIAFSGLIAFGVLIYSGFLYATSTGSPQKMSDALNRIYSAVIGLIVLFGSYLFLTTINPQLTIINPGVSPVGKGIIVFKSRTDCNKFQAAGLSNLDINKEEGRDYLFLQTSKKDLGDLKNQVGAVYFYQGADDLQVTMHSEINYKDVSQYPPFPKTFTGQEQARGQCYPGAEVDTYSAESIELLPQSPGVYLCLEKELGTCLGPLVKDTPQLGGEFNDKVKYVRFQNPDANTKYGVILFEHDKFGQFKKSTCKVFLSSRDTGEGEFVSAQFLSQSGTAPAASSAMVFVENPKAQGEGVTVWEDIDYGGRSKGPFRPDSGSSIRGIRDLDFRNAWEDVLSSVEINGSFWAVLFGESNFGLERPSACQVYKTSDPNVDNEPIKGDSVSSLQVIGVGAK